MDDVWRALMEGREFAELVLDRPAWHEQARCRGVGAEVFFPARGQPTSLGRHYCAVCPVVVECRDYAVEHEELGVWGDTSNEERRRLRRGRVA